MGWVRSKLGHLNREARCFISQSSSPGPVNGPLDTTDVSTHSVHVTHAGDTLPVLKLFSVKAAIAELFATAMFVYIGTGTAVTFSSRVDYSGDGGYTAESLDFTAPATEPVTNLDEAADVARNTQESLTAFGQDILVNGSWGVTVAFAFGLAITVLAFATGHISGGQLNPAVTFALACVGSLPFGQAIANTISQVVGAILGSALLDATIPDGNGGSLGSNSITPGVGYGNALCGEIVMTGVLVATVLETAVSKGNVVSKSFAPLAIGFAVFCAHAVLLPIDGCSINPARSLGPAIVSGTWPGTFWVFVVGPYLGALAAIPFYLFFQSNFEKDVVAQLDPLNISSENTEDPYAGKKAEDV
jgi:MIP family channel proteins